MSDEEEIPEGIVAGKYRLTKLLGRGGMGSVWEGVHVDLGTRVAVKFIDQAHASSEEIRNRFVNEAKAAAQLRSKHVVQVYDQGVTQDERPYIVMEFLEGEPLDARLDRVGSLSVAETATILLQVARALTKAHELGIVHRDLKPENVFLVWDHEDHMDVAKVVDFGIAKFTDAQTGASSGSTRTGAVLGTPHYMSPEQARGLRTVDARTDVWSLGVIAFRCITGTLPFEGEAVGDLLVKICTVPAPVPSTIAADVPNEFDAFVARALAKDVETRFQSARELADSLADLAGLERRGPMSGPSAASGRGGAPARTGPSASGGTQAPLTTTLRGSQSRAPVLVGMLLVAVLALVAGAFVFSSRGTGGPEATAESTPALSPVAPSSASPPAEPTVAPSLPEPSPAASSSKPAASVAPPSSVAPAPVAAPAAKVAPRPKAFAPSPPRPAPALPVAPPPPKPAPKRAPDLLGY